MQEINEEISAIEKNSTETLVATDEPIATPYTVTEDTVAAPVASDDALLKPGTKIRPELNEDDVQNLAQRLYGITIEHKSELAAYDDRNYFITADSRYKNPIITQGCPHGYILKVLNALDSKKIPFIDAQTKLLRFVSENGISCPKPVANVYGRNYSLEPIRGTEHVIRLLEYIPGKTLDSVPFNDHLFYQAGVFVANFDRVVSKFEHEGYVNHQSMWQLENVDKLEQFVYVLKDEEKQMLIEEVITQFKKQVLSRLDEFQKGLIHGDFNEHNILVTKNEITKQHYVSGILDFGDTSYSHYLFEVAIAMTYMMLTSKNLKAGGLLLAGYETVRVMPKEEKALLKVRKKIICEIISVAGLSSIHDKRTTTSAIMISGG